MNLMKVKRSNLSNSVLMADNNKRDYTVKFATCSSRWLEYPRSWTTSQKFMFKFKGDCGGHDGEVY